MFFLKKIKSFILLFFVLFGISSSTLLTINEETNLLKINTKMTSVSTAEEFIDAANSNVDIDIANDIDFSSIGSESYGISNYTGTINGNGYSFLNSNIYLNSDGTNVLYLFENFNGIISNLVFDNFKFFAKVIGDPATTSVGEKYLNNIQIKNVEISGLEINYEVNLANPIIDYEMGILAAEAYGYQFINISIVNSSFHNNTINIYGDSGNGFRNEIRYGYFIGSATNVSLEKIYIINNSFYENTLSSIYVDQANTIIQVNDQVPASISFFIGYIFQATVSDVFLTNNTINNNEFKVARPRLGGIFGFSSDITMNRVYQNKFFLTDNNFYGSESYSNGRVGNIIGYDNSGANTGINSLVMEEININNNQGNDAFGSGSYVLEANQFANITTSVTNSIFLVKRDGSTTPEDIDKIDGYRQENELNFDFWNSTVNFNQGGTSSVWNLNAFVESDLTISSDNSGYPLFNTASYITNSFDYTSESNATITLNTILNEAIIDNLTVNSIFGDSFEFNANTTTKIDTGIESTFFQTRTDEEIRNLLNEIYWINPTSSVDTDLILIGNITNSNTKTYPELTPGVQINIGSTPVTGGNQLNFTYEIINNDLGLYDERSDASQSINVETAYGTESINLDGLSTITIPDYVTPIEYNQYYRIDTSPLTFKYLGMDKTINSITDITVNNLFLNNTDVAPIELPIPSLDVQTTLNTDKTIDIDIFVENFDSIIYTGEGATDLSNTEVILSSTFAEFDTLDGTDEFSQKISIEEFTFNSETSILNTTVDIASNVPPELASSYYSIQLNTTLKYYLDLSSTKTQISDITYSGNITNGVIDKYDLTKEYSGFIDTSYDYESNQITLTFNETEAYRYLVDYDFNFTIDSFNGSQEVNLNSELSSQTITLEQEFKEWYDYKLEENSEVINFNDFYTISLSETSSSYYNFISSLGTIETNTFTNLEYQDITSPTSSRSENIVITGDFTNINGTTTPAEIPVVPEVIPPVLPPVDPPSVDPLSPSDEVQNFILYIVIILILLIIIILITNLIIRSR